MREVSAETQYEILGRHNDGLLVKVDHKAHCKGVWFPGVATMVGLDVKLHIHQSAMFRGPLGRSRSGMSQAKPVYWFFR
jgi:hypothetical protein